MPSQSQPTCYIVSKRTSPSLVLLAIGLEGSWEWPLGFAGCASGGAVHRALARLHAHLVGVAQDRALGHGEIITQDLLLSPPQAHAVVVRVATPQLVGKLFGDEFVLLLLLLPHLNQLVVYPVVRVFFHLQLEEQLGDLARLDPTLFLLLRQLALNLVHLFLNVPHLVLQGMAIPVREGLPLWFLLSLLHIPRSQQFLEVCDLLFLVKELLSHAHDSLLRSAPCLLLTMCLCLHLLQLVLECLNFHAVHILPRLRDLCCGRLCPVLCALSPDVS
mmetsp:Transcript_22887/g.56504  ORF Transcript_22887/g.56504 Transcript_22887/m.56504 type:complete len:274 (+) Transcript_22887:90-911(+)